MHRKLPHYSPVLVGLVRSLDAAEMAVRTVGCHFGDMEMLPETEMDDPESVASWANMNVNAFGDSLPVLRELFRKMVKAENIGVVIEANALGDACAPPFVLAVFDPIQESLLKHRPSSDIAIATLTNLPDSVKVEAGGSKVVYWDGEVYVIPADVPDSFVEVWFRRAFGYWHDGGAYPLRLDRRNYGWQAFGIER
jgi:hypothetical protein